MAERSNLVRMHVKNIGCIGNDGLTVELDEIVCLVGANNAGKLLADLSERLERDYGRGYSVDNLEAFRQFYLEYPSLISETVSRNFVLPAISETPSRKSGGEDETDSWQPGILNPNLSWSHYRCLLRVGRQAARDFYEIEAVNHAWSVRELSRQIGSLLFDRLAKSRDKKGLMRLAVVQEVARPIDSLKDPMVLEFLNLSASPCLVESKLEDALIGNLQTFLLELDKGFGRCEFIRTVSYVRINSHLQMQRNAMKQ